MTYQRNQKHPWARWLAHLTPLLIVVLSTFAAPAPAAADPNPGVETIYHSRRGDPGGDTSTTLVKPSLYTGDAAMSIPIAAPRGTGGVQPGLAVSYSSSRSRGNAGVGWSIGLPKITRSTRYGADLAATWKVDEAVYMYGGDELIRDASATMTDPFGCQATVYYREVERFQKLLLCEDANEYWVVIQKDGTVQTFGKLTANNSELVHPSTGKTMEYYLDEVRDTHDLLWQAYYSAYGSPNSDSAPRLEKVEYTFFEGVTTLPVGDKRVVDLQPAAPTTKRATPTTPGAVRIQGQISPIADDSFHYD